MKNRMKPTKILQFLLMVTERILLGKLLYVMLCRIEEVENKTAGLRSNDMDDTDDADAMDDVDDVRKTGDAPDKDPSPKTAPIDVDAGNTIELNTHLFLKELNESIQEKGTICFVDKKHKDRLILSVECRKYPGLSTKIGTRSYVRQDRENPTQQFVIGADSKYEEMERTAYLIACKACHACMQERVNQHDAIWLKYTNKQYEQPVRELLKYWIHVDPDGHSTHSCNVVTAKGAVPVSILIKTNLDGTGQTVLSLYISDDKDISKSVSYDMRESEIPETAVMVADEIFYFCDKYATLKW